MVAFEKRYHRTSSNLGFVGFRRLLNIFDIQNQGGVRFSECFKPGMAVWDIESLFSECFKPGTAV